MTTRPGRWFSVSIDMDGVQSITTAFAPAELGMPPDGLEGWIVTVGVPGTRTVYRAVIIREHEIGDGRYVVLSCGPVPDTPPFCDVHFLSNESDKTYLYSNTFIGLRVGDRVMVETRHGDAPAEVVRVMAERPVTEYTGALRRVLSVMTSPDPRPEPTCPHCGQPGRRLSSSQAVCTYCDRTFNLGGRTGAALPPNARCVISPHVPPHLVVEPVKTKRRINL